MTWVVYKNLSRRRWQWCLALEDKLGDPLRQLESSELLSGGLKGGNWGEMLDSHQDSEYGYLMCSTEENVEAACGEDLGDVARA